MGCYVHPLNGVSAGTKAERMTWRRTSAKSQSFSRTSLLFPCTSIDFSLISKFDSFNLGKSQHLLCHYSLRSLILRSGALGVGQVSASAYHGRMDAPAHQSLGWHLWQVTATPKPPPLGLQQTGQVELYRLGRQSTLEKETPNNI